MSGYFRIRGNYQRAVPDVVADVPVRSDEQRDERMLLPLHFLLVFIDIEASFGNRHAEEVLRFFLLDLEQPVYPVQGPLVLAFMIYDDARIVAFRQTGSRCGQGS